MKPVPVVVNDLMQQGYVYFLTEPIGQNFHPDFRPDLTPKEMLELGVFGATGIAAPGSAKRCCSGHMIPGTPKFPPNKTLQPTGAAIRSRHFGQLFMHQRHPNTTSTGKHLEAEWVTRVYTFLDELVLVG